MTTASLVAERSRSSLLRLLQRVFSFPVMLGGFLVVLSVLTVRPRFDDPDMWWHLKTGEIIWTTHTIPTTDLFSYTTNHHPYTPHEWLSQALIFGAYRFGGYPGLMLWLCFFTSAILIAGYCLCSLYSGNSKIGFVGALTIWLFATTGFAIRPQMIGYLLLIVELLILHLGRTRNPLWLLALPPLFAVWVNVHGSFFFGIILAGTVLFSSFFDFEIGSLASQAWDSSRRRTLALAVSLSIGALFLNPIGVKQILYPLDTLLHQPIGLSQVEEWQPLQMGDPRGLAMLGVLACICLIVIVRKSNLLWHELLVLALGTWVAAGHRRMLFVFGILAAPVLSRVLSGLWEGYDAENDRPVPNAVFLAASLFTAVWAFPGLPMLTKQVNEGSPVRAVEFIESNHLSGRMLNDYVYGGYLIWAAPEHPVFVDGRADVFEWTGVFSEFGKWATLRSDPNVLLDKYRVDFCLLSRESPMAVVIPLLHGWKTAYSDDQAVIFVRSAANKPVE